MKTTTFLTFVGDQCGKAEEAINFYTSIFPNSEIRSLIKYSEGEVGGTPSTDEEVKSNLEEILGEFREEDQEIDKHLKRAIKSSTK